MSDKNSSLFEWKYFLYSFSKQFFSIFFLTEVKICIFRFSLQIFIWYVHTYILEKIDNIFDALEDYISRYSGDCSRLSFLPSFFRARTCARHAFGKSPRPYSAHRQK